MVGTAEKILPDADRKAHPLLDGGYVSTSRRYRICWLSKLLRHAGFIAPKTLSDELDLSSEQFAARRHDLNLDLASHQREPTKDDEDSRETWSGKFEFFLTCIGYCVGFGNIWRFPFQVYRNGGGAFLIPYMVFLVTCGIPLVFMEMALGQYSSLTAIHLFGQFSPLFKGLGYAMITITFFVCIYYSTVQFPVTQMLFGDNGGFSQPPWTRCDPSWASNRCFVANYSTGASLETHVAANKSDRRLRISAAEEYWHRGVLKLSDGIENFGSVRVELLICLVVAWICVFLCSFKGIRSSGKVVYFTSTFPLLMLLILMIKGCMLPGASDGLRLFLYPDFSRLKDFQVWFDAAMQIFYAMAPGWGGLLSFASFNKYNVNIYKYGLMIPMLNFVVSMTGGIAVFSVIGYLSYMSGIRPEAVVENGPGLTFIVYPQAINSLPFSPMWTVLFFATLFTVGIDSQFGMFETLVSALVDEYAFFRRHRTIFTAIACTCLCLLGIVCVTEAGMYWVQIIDWYSAFMTLMIICIIECILVGWVYGAERFRQNIHSMVGFTISPLWCIMWKYVTPLIVGCLLLGNFYFSPTIVYEDYHFPKWAVSLGWALALSSSLPIPCYAFFKLCRTKGTFIERVTGSVHCLESFGPTSSPDREAVLLDGTGYSNCDTHVEEPISVCVRRTSE